jgi:membrane protein required for colicin V production
VTLFDLIAGVVILVSGLIGFARGAVREMVTVLAFILAALAAVFLLPVAGPLARAIIKPGWAGSVVAMIAVFLAVYVVLRVMGSRLTAKLHTQAALGMLDRGIGVGFGVVRAMIVLGLFYIVFNAATPREWTPDWIGKAKLYPAARASAGVIRAFAPKGMTAAGRFGPKVQEAVSDGFSATDQEADLEAGSDEPVAPGTPRGKETTSEASKKLQNRKSYGKSQRDGIDALVERSR